MHDRRIFASGANQKCTGKRLSLVFHLPKILTIVQTWTSCKNVMISRIRHASQINATIGAQASQGASIIIMSATEVHLLFS